MNERGELRADVVGAQDRRNHLGDLRGRHRAYGHRFGEPAAPPGLRGSRQRVEAVELVTSVRSKQHDPTLRETAGQVLEELAG